MQPATTKCFIIIIDGTDCHLHRVRNVSIIATIIAIAIIVIIIAIVVIIIAIAIIATIIAIIVIVRRHFPFWRL